MKTKAPKLTICETRAKAFCESLAIYDGGDVGVEWKRSAMWGSNPAITHRGGKCTNISGCGYDKLSAALASVLCFLFTYGSDEFNAIASLGGCGVSSVESALEKLGWKLDRTATSSTFDGFRLSRIGKGGK